MQTHRSQHEASELRLYVDSFVDDRENSVIGKKIGRIVRDIESDSEIKKTTHERKNTRETLNVTLFGKTDFCTDDPPAMLGPHSGLATLTNFENNYATFATLKAVVDVKKYDMISANLQENIKSHLQMLTEEFRRYFPEYNWTESKGAQKLIRNSFDITV
ncbi:hypothetical protein LOAG_02758 [Loa loa]|uniref:Uncharacterized protein n=1 Tax=Loa loa TaxID=7209 RepID=A0A1S0U7T3_LOALO|nr:hypothetical protein LOAG_02758 [Loa loa]EFO25731.1 hypothetical protein LOAG_02758 [Loa loa]